MVELKECYGVEGLTKEVLGEELFSLLTKQSRNTKYYARCRDAKYSYFCDSFLSAIGLVRSNLRLKGAYKELRMKVDILHVVIGDVHIDIWAEK
jgi:hypothetical protein